jgi:transposase-like protein
MSVNITAPIYNDEEAARKHFEASRWPDGPVCHHCGSVNNAHEMQGESTRPGLYKCRDCRKPFSATMGTLYERSHIPLHKWLLATHLMTASKKGISAHQLFRMLGFGSYRTAWFMAMRIRESMRELFPEEAGKMGGEGKIVEADETFVGGKEKNKHRNKRTSPTGGGTGKEAVFSLVERGGKVRSRHVPSVNAKTLGPVLREQLDTASSLMTDGEGQYRILGPMFARHEVVNHSIGEYVRGEAHTNTIEGYFSILKRGIYGTYHHVSPQHLKRYLAEFDFRYNERAALDVNDTQRAAKALKGVAGKRLTYRQPDGRKAHGGEA